MIQLLKFVNEVTLTHSPSRRIGRVIYDYVSVEAVRLVDRLHTHVEVLLPHENLAVGIFEKVARTQPILGGHYSLIAGKA